MTDNPTLKAVIAYATERGWHVFPLKAGTKISHKSEKHSGSKWGATSNPVEIARDFKRWPDAGVGLMCGAESGVFVLDIDTAGEPPRRRRHGKSRQADRRERAAAGDA